MFLQFSFLNHPYRVWSLDCQFLTEAFDICKEDDFTGLPGKCEKCKEFHLNQYRVRQLNRFGLFIQLKNKVVRFVYKIIKIVDASMYYESSNGECKRREGQCHGQ